MNSDLSGPTLQHLFLRLFIPVIGFKWAGIVLLSLLATAGNIPAQQHPVKFNRISTENALIVKGLSQNSIYCLMQDTRGFIWIGTWDGLNKYDGYNFIVYNTTNGLSNPTINALLEDEEGIIWIGTDDGLNLLDRNSQKIEQFNLRNEKKSTSKRSQVTNLYRDSRNQLWICTSSGLKMYDKVHKSIKSYNFYMRGADSAFSNHISKVLEDGKGKIWIATHSGIHCLDLNDDSFAQYRLERTQEFYESRRSNYVLDIIIDSNNKVYAATLNGIFVIDPASGKVNTFFEEKGYPGELSSSQVNSLMLDKRGQFWIGTSQGLDVYDPVSNTMNNYCAGGSIVNLSNNDVRSLYQDQSGTIWIGTYKGLNKVDMSPSRFNHINHDSNDPNSLSDNIVYSILEIEDSLLWIATYGGVNILNRKTGRYSIMLNDPSNPGSISSNKIRTLALDSAGYIWVGTESDGLNRINRSNGIIKHYRYDPQDGNTIPEDNILSSYVDGMGRIWIGTVSKGVGIIDPSDGKITRLSADPNSRVRLSDNRVWSVFEDRSGNFWLGGGHGLNKLSNDLRQNTIYTNNPDDPNSLGNDLILSINQDRNGIIWIGTMGGGLCRLDPATGKFTTYTENDGLPNNVIYCSIEDDEGNLWLTSNRGISKYSGKDGTFVNYDTKDGVQGNEFNSGAYFQNRKGEIFFGGMSGINIFHPSEIVRNEIPPRMVFTGVWVLNDLQQTDIEDHEIIRLDYNENFFSIEFSALDFTNPAKNQYRYKLENYDQDWIYSDATERKADYRKVDPGNYLFVVTGSNNDGVWNQEGISLTIIIRPPWWKSWIFRIMVVLILVSLAWSLILLRIRSIRRKHSVEKKMLSIEKQIFELEQKALRLQMNPHFIFNSLNAIQNFVLANDTDKAVNYLAKFSHLMRMILANSTASLITLKDEMKALTYYIDLEKLRFDDRFDYIINKDPSIDEEFVEIPPMLFQPYVENAIIHGLVNSPKQGLLEIYIKRIDSATLLCSIKDNGIGREKAIEIRNKSGIKRQPKGMMITQERLEIFNRQNRKNFSVKITDLKDENGDAAGTMVEFIIQYKET